MISYVLAMGKQHLGPHVVVGYGIKIFWPGLFITSPDHLELGLLYPRVISFKKNSCLALPETGVAILVRGNTSICLTVFSLELNLQ